MKNCNELFLENEFPEIIFLDINMPRKNGFQCLEVIRNTSGSFRQIKVVMFSTSSSPSNIELSYELGADFYAVKPSTFQTRKELLQQIMNLDWTLIRRDKDSFVLDV